MNTSMIKIEGLTFSYGKKASVFRDFSLEMEAGKVIGLLGKNGTGKSTLLYLMSGLLRPQNGSVWMKGIDVQKRLPVTLEDMYLVPEEFTLPNLSLKQFVKVNAPFYPRFSQELLRTCLADFDLNEDIHLGELSMGQKKKAYMCFALAANTSLLLMDEPTNGLDIPSKSQFRKVIASGMTEEKSVVVSTHQVRDIDRKESCLVNNIGFILLYLFYTVKTKRDIRRIWREKQMLLILIIISRLILMLFLQKI